MKRRKLTAEMKQRILGTYGNKCINCGSCEEIEFHHVVPLEIGGNDVWQNIVPLCYSCHKAVTHHQLVLATTGRQHKSGGRKRIIPGNYKDILWRYIRCEIGKQECKDLLGISKSNNLSDNTWYREFLNENGIKKIRNNIDIKVGQGRALHVGDMIGFIVYDDGRMDTMFWRVA